MNVWSVLVRYVDNDKVVDVIQILSNLGLGDVWMDIADREIPSGSDRDFVGDMARQNELTLVPCPFNLRMLSIRLRAPSIYGQLTRFP